VDAVMKCCRGCVFAVMLYVSNLRTGEDRAEL
jgi:hypothetical protein